MTRSRLWSPGSGAPWPPWRAASGGCEGGWRTGTRAAASGPPLCISPAEGQRQHGPVCVCVCGWATGGGRGAGGVGGWGCGGVWVWVGGGGDLALQLGRLAGVPGVQSLRESPVQSAGGCFLPCFLIFALEREKLQPQQPAAPPGWPRPAGPGAHLALQRRHALHKLALARCCELRVEALTQTSLSFFFVFVLQKKVRVFLWPAGSAPQPGPGSPPSRQLCLMTQMKSCL